MRLEHVEVVHDVPEPVPVLGDRDAARLGRERERRAALAVPVGGLEADLAVRLVDRGVVREPGHVLDGQPHCCCCASCIASAPIGSARLEKYAFVTASPAAWIPVSSSRSVWVTASPEMSPTSPYSSEATSRPMIRCGAPWSLEIRETASRLLARQYRTARGKSAERISSSAIGIGSNSVPCRFTYASKALHDSSSAISCRARAGIGAVERDGDRVARGDDPDRLRRPFELEAEPDELVRIAVGHRRIRRALEEVGAVAELLEERVRPARDGAPVRAAHEQEQLVDRLPHLAGDLLAHRAGVLARERDAVGDRVGVAVVPEHPVAHVDRGRLVVVLPVALLVAEQLHDLEPRLPAILDLGVEERVEVDVEEARDVLGALDVARRPVERFGDPAQHRRAPSHERTQVSLLPPPCDELTTSEPGRERRPREAARDDAGRVGAGEDERAQVDVAPAQLAVDERRVARERDRGLGDVVARLGEDQAAELLALLRGRGGADQHPVAARLVDRLDDQLLEVVEHVREVVGIGRVEGRHVAEDRLLAEVEADHLRHVRVDRLVVGDAGADRVGERHVAGAIGVEQAGHAEQAVLAEGERVEEVVVDAPVDDVDALHAPRRAVEDAVAVDDEIARLDDLDAHLAAEERVLEVRRVVGTRA